MHITNDYPEPTIKTRRKYITSQKFDFEWFDSDEERAEYWDKISALCCHLNELTAYKSALHEENWKL